MGSRVASRHGRLRPLREVRHYIAVKVDYVRQGNQSSFITAPDSFNIGLGWWF
jgi:hypothetical protein